ncbi:hypothetical protein EYF80_020711 [Liparis tanakae]|uniref:Uncharacterized protein n=1 Tax=Liparis tanakae TaxID=230148 RepID=A0A4Z2HTC7_9TELE|nr:hypothetical protein EYF80_020711 [Liparis tanakae]
MAQGSHLTVLNTLESIKSDAESEEKDTSRLLSFLGGYMFKSNAGIQVEMSDNTPPPPPPPPPPWTAVSAQGGAPEDKEGSPPPVRSPEHPPRSCRQTVEPGQLQRHRAANVLKIVDY